MRVKVELAAQPRLLATEPGDSIGGLPIVATVPGGAHALVNVPDDWTAAQIDAWAQPLLAAGLLTTDGQLWRPEHTDYTVLWLPPSEYLSLANITPGDTFPLCGVTEATQRRGQWGAGVGILHMDTGVDKAHVAFAGKTFARADADDHGHGTHTASTCASAWGVAPDAVLYSANVLPGGSGSESGIAAGMRQAVDWAVAQRIPAVMTMSLGGSASGVIDDAVTYARQRGVVVVAAAGNTPNVAIGSPARAADLIVLAVDRARQYASFTSGTNWTNANRVSQFGVDIAAAARGTPDGALVMSGTSMGTPAAAGQVALLLAGGVR